jgi:translation initiation factor IF-2
LRDKPSSGAATPGAAGPAKPRETGGVKKLADLTPEQMGIGRKLTVQDVIQGQIQVPTNLEATDLDDDGDGKRDGKKRPGPGQVQGRDQRKAQRNDRAKERNASPGVAVAGGKLVEVEDRPLRIRDRLKKKAHARQPGTAPRKGNVVIDLPITVRSLSEAVGLTVPKLLQKLSQPPYDFPFGSVTINSVLESDIAQLIAHEVGCELEIRKTQDAEDVLIAKHQEVDDPAKLQPRPPIVAVMGHVDHGKTSLLDRIRKSNVAAGEVGGITQVIRAWQIEHHGKPITFLDTPGHEAFTKMRARGAQVTDIAVIVVAADDGVMPQTEEAINHAKAAGVSIIVAINKIDLPNANLNKTRQTLYGMGVLPDNMGGDVPFIETSAAKGTGIDALLEAIQLVAELKELKANPDKHARGTCLEAHLSGDEGVNATLLVQDGTLKKGDIVLCGAAHGRVRAMYNDLGHPIETAGPSSPVRITGLDEVPDADDPFNVVDDITTAREIAEKRSSKRQRAAHVPVATKTLEMLGETKVTELKVILKADFRGSIEAIRKELEKLQHDEVRVRVLHAAIGGITPSDVQLAMTSPTDTMIVGFNAVPDDEARALAEQNGIPIREYNIIYNLTDDIKAALEGKLKPREEIVYLGRAVVREVFKISKVGWVAGSHVTQGTIERSAKVRIIRDGVVIYPPAERTAGLESLKHHKDDVKEIKQGYDCGIKVAGYDDIKVGDVIEAYRVEEIKRTL